MNEVLIVEDEANVRELMRDVLSEDGLNVQAVGTVAAAEAHLARRAPDLLLLDVKLPDGDGLELLARLRARGLEVPAVVITAFGTVERAVQAMHAGARDFLVKPFDNARFRSAVAAALLAGRQLAEVELCAGELQSDDASAALVGAKGGLKDVVALIRRVAGTDATVLIQGESGTGKALVARAIHESSRRLDGPFVALDCSAIAPSLIESELFGFERGAFTGAHAQRKGFVETAEGGTLFLDEIGDMQLEAQSRLLHVLQEREITRVGGREPVPVDVRIIAATHRDLAQLSAAGAFRHDLLYRLDVVHIRLPALCDRISDLPGLLDHFLQKHSARHQALAPRVDAAALAALGAYGWPGNVRELENWVERSVILGHLDLSTLKAAPRASGPAVEVPAPEAPEPAEEGLKTLRQAVAEAERAAVVAALRHAGGNKARAARLLGVSYKTLFNKIHEHDIKEAVRIE